MVLHAVVSIFQTKKNSSEFFFAEKIRICTEKSRRVLYPSCIVAPRYWRVLVLSGCLFKSEIGNRKSFACFQLRARSPTPTPLRSASLSGCPVVVPSPRFVSFPRLDADLPRFTGPSSHPTIRYRFIVLVLSCRCRSVSSVLAPGGPRDEDGRTTSERDGRTHEPDE